MTKGFLFFASMVLFIAAWAPAKTPTAPTSAQSGMSVPLAHLGHGAATAERPQPTIRILQLTETRATSMAGSMARTCSFTTRSRFSVTRSRQLRRSPASLEPRRTRLRVQAQFRQSTLSLPRRPSRTSSIRTLSARRAGTACLNHPLMIDLSRIGLSPTAGPAAHNHILTSRGGGWFHTVNIRVFSLAAWNEIAAAKTLSKVRQLQGDPNVGTAGVISADTPTNIYFFIASWRPGQE